MYACTNELAFICACACMYTSACCRCMGYFSLSPARANDATRRGRAYIPCARTHVVIYRQLLTHVWSRCSMHIAIGCTLIAIFWEYRNFNKKKSYHHPDNMYIQLRNSMDSDVLMSRIVSRLRIFMDLWDIWRCKMQKMQIGAYKYVIYSMCDIWYPI